ncbi:MAG: transglutaminase TgpA family protein [Thermodesulfobacteriota bacterium]
MRIAYFTAVPKQQGSVSLDQEKKEAIPIIIALVSCIAPHVPGLPLWITLWCMAMWGYMLARFKTGWPLPSVSMRYLLTFIGLAGLLATFRQGIGADAFVGLMALMAAIKPFEMPTHRHRMITLLLSYFIIITSLFRSDALVIMIYMIFSVFVTTTALIRINAPDINMNQCRRLAGTILAQALPLVVVLFLVFPRLPDSLFGVQDPTAGRSGFSNTLSPGKISSLAKDQTPAFWAEFRNVRPRSDQLYWRAIVFEEFDGRTWRPLAEKTQAAGNHPTDEVKKAAQSQAAIVQTILLAPHNAHWLMALDRPVKGPNWALNGQGRTLKSRKKVTKKIQYEVTSLIPGDANHPLEPVPDQNLAAKIISGNGVLNPKTREFAQTLRQTPGTPADKVRRALAYFRKNGFSYTLTPPPLGTHPIDDFLFNTQSGYCEHYASALAFLLNSAGIPARVVGGYLGGELNPFGNFLTVRQSYAHAWVEYFDSTAFNNTGDWIRTDPTGVVVPNRVRTNPDGSSVRIAPGNRALPFMTRLGFALEALNLRWETWFTGYSAFEQNAWLKAMGLIKNNQASGPILFFLTLCGISLFAGILIWRFKKKPVSSDPVALSFEQFTDKLSKAGIVRAPGQGPVAFAQACIDERSDLADEIELIMDLYIGLRYKGSGSGMDSDQEPDRFRVCVKRFRPSKKKKR